MMWKTPAAALALAVLLPACASVAQPTSVETSAGAVQVETIADNLARPWGLAFLPGGGFLITERTGNLRRVAADGTVSSPLGGVPEVAPFGQGGLLDVVLAPDFATSRWVYLSFSEPGPGGASTAVARGRLNQAGTALEGTETIFSQEPKVRGGRHFGSRLVFARDGRLFVTSGDRGQETPSQKLGDTIGTVVRLEADGRVPADNPFVGQAGARPEIWSYGHRNAQGAALNPRTGALWLTEHGPRGGDEVNIAEAGKNYGWPLVSWGTEYSGGAIPNPPTRPDLTDAIHQWTPVIAASGLAFYDGDLFPQWRGSLLAGGLVARGVVRLSLDGNRVTGEERIGLGARVRDVRQGPDGAVYVLTDAPNGKLLRLTPQR